ncbi:tautomerase family protein [Roseomonas sp. USHLN139]|uniref:tautomerase family protein n=1 Tax=Roseomonas sp. USHLN139 TaxID=3081298 RepID=UPI003B01BDFF
MPYLELLAPPLDAASRAVVVGEATVAVCTAFGVGPETVSIYFLDVPASHYGHAGRMGEAGPQRILAKLHAYRRDAAARRRAAGLLTPLLARHYGVPAQTLAVYFFDRALDEVAHGGRLSSDAEPG